VPANRSRTERWRDCLGQICSRGGGIELTPACAETGFEASHLLMRVKLHKVDREGLVVESPNAVGGKISFEPGQAVIGVMSIGQNRWMFHSRVVGPVPGGYGDLIRLEDPHGVERCQRRGFYRISTMELSLPEVRCWPLLDPRATGVAESAARALVDERRASGATGPVDKDVENSVLPEVGPPFKGRVVNVSGGGLGLVVDRSEAGAVDELRHYWIALDLDIENRAPICMATRIVHTHIDSSMNVYCGMSFEFSGTGEHRNFVIREIGRYMDRVLDPGRKAA